MKDRGIRRTFPLSARIFEFLVQTPIFKYFARLVYKCDWSKVYSLFFSLLSLFLSLSLSQYIQLLI